MSKLWNMRMKGAKAELHYTSYEYSSMLTIAYVIMLDYTVKRNDSKAHTRVDYTHAQT